MAVTQPELWHISYKWIEGQTAALDDHLVGACSNLFSSQYGIWGQSARSAGGPIRTTPRQVRDHLVIDGAWIACAYRDDELIGYCIVLRDEVGDRGRLTWVVQLVVHATYRNRRVATRLLYSMWQFSDDWAWGLVTANPYAVRALETATRRKCDPTLIVSEEGAAALQHVAAKVDYIPDSFVQQDGDRPIVDTAFFIDLTNLPAMLEASTDKRRPWALEQIEDGQEWFACTFSSQSPQPLGPERLNELLQGSDEIWMQAYEGMTLDEEHGWRKYAMPEAEHACKVAQLRRGARVLDVGCGDGRHVEAFVELGMNPVGIDISPILIKRASARISIRGRVSVGDARDPLPGQDYELITYFYDVLGSSARTADDRVILQHAANALAEGGTLMLSVMNATATLALLQESHQPQDETTFVEALEQLPPSHTMETSGDVFQPALMLHYDGVFYRKEQFDAATERLPVELVVRDRRFTAQDLIDLIAGSGLELISITPARAGHWNAIPARAEEDPKAKEFLVVARHAQPD